MIETKQEKFRISKLLGISEEDIDDSIIPILVYLETAGQKTEDNLAKVEQQVFTNLKEATMQIGKYEQLLNKNVQPIYCDKPSTAFFAGAGKASVYAFCVTLVVCVFQLCYTLKEVNKQEFAHQKKLMKVIHYDAPSDRFFIEASKLSKEKNGLYTLKLGE